MNSFLSWSLPLYHILFQQNRSKESIQTESTHNYPRSNPSQIILAWHSQFQCNFKLQHIHQKDEGWNHVAHQWEHASLVSWMLVRCFRVTEKSWVCQQVFSTGEEVTGWFLQSTIWHQSMVMRTSRPPCRDILYLLVAITNQKCSNFMIHCDYSSLDHLALGVLNNYQSSYWLHQHCLENLELQILLKPLSVLQNWVTS